MAKTKVVVVTHTMPRYAGDPAAAFMTGLGNGLVDAGLDVTFLAPWHAKFRKNPQQKFRTVTYHYFPIRSLETFGYSGALEGDMKIRPWQMVLAPIILFFGTFTLIRLIRREQVQIVSAHWLVPNGVIAAIAKMFTHVTTHVSLPGSDVFLAQRNPLVRPFAVWAARRADLITSNSPALAKDLQTLGVRKMIKLMVYGVEPTEFRAATESARRRTRNNTETEKVTILGVGRLVPKKGFHILIAAFARITKKFRAAKLILVGDGSERRALEQQTRSLGIEHQVTFTGTASTSQLKKHYQNADIFVLPSVRDERGNLDDQSVVSLEAMASGLPVITTDFPGYRLTINHAQTGYLFKEGSVEELATYLTNLLIHANIRATMGAAARKAVARQFSWRAIGKQYRNLFEHETK
ncbi:glycosyltransferase [Candidatus Berkelbacteria bacterium]|nr:glycosyltransferase [Candidatus Berkelbacteria bacterium]